MRVLGIETSGSVCGLAVLDGEGLAGQIEFRHRMDLARRFLPALDRLLLQVELRAADLDGIAVSLGPGSFTGLRIGVTTAKSLAWSLGIPVAGVSTLDALAAAIPLPAGGTTCALLRMAGDELAAAFYGPAPAGPVPLGPPAILALAELLARCEALPGPVLFTGAVEPDAETVRARLGDRAAFAPPVGATPPAAAVARLGAARLAARAADDVETLAPLYLRASTPELRRLSA